jgi:PAS domain S-box-containing protein
MAARRHVGSLVRRYFLGLIAVALPLLMLIAGLAVAQFRAERATLLDTMARDAADLQLMLDEFLKYADDHVRQMRRSAEHHLSGLLPTPPSPLRGLLGTERWDSDGMRGEGLFLGGVAGTGLDKVVGNLHGRGDLLSRRGSDDREIDMALGLFEPMHLAHLTAPHLRWSYYFSARGDFLTVYPYASGRDFIQGMGLHSVDEYISAMYGYDVYRLSLPAVNPAGTGYWTPVYLDVGGAGWMVSHAAPVYANGVFAGMVGTDVLLDFLSVFLAERRHYSPGRAWVIDERGDLLADSGGMIDRSAAAQRVEVALGGVPALADLLAPSPAPKRINGREVISRRLTPAPWHLVVVADESEITRLVLERLWPYGLMLSGVLAALVLAQQTMQRFFVGPAIALAYRVREQSGSGGEPGDIPRVPELWRQWFMAVDEAFQSSRRSLARIREEQALKAAVVEATFDSIITIDEAGKVVEFSAGAEAVFGYRRDDAIGQPISTLIVPPYLREQHEEGLRRYITTGERHFLGQRIEIEGQRADGSIFPVELAIAEVRLPGRRLFTAYLRDITDRNRAEQALLESERQFRAIVEDQTELICRFDSEFRLTFSNRAHARLFGAEPEALKGEYFFNSIPEHIAKDLRRDLLALTPENPTFSAEHEKELPGGEIRWFAWTNRALFDAAGRLSGFQCVGRDISEARQARETLSASAAELALIADCIPTTVVIVRVGQAEILFANTEAQELFGLHQGSGLDEIAAVYENPADRARFLRRVAEDGVVEGFELPMRRQDGTVIRALISARAIDFRGSSAIVAVVTDITARLEMEQALRASEARLAAFMQHAPAGMYLKDLKGRYIMVNPEMERVLNRPMTRIIGRAPEDIFKPGDAATIRIHDQEVLRKGAIVVNEEYLPYMPNYTWRMVIRFPIRDEPGRISHLAGFVVDISSRKRAEIEADRQRAATHQREKLAALGSLLAGVAHELNNPLSVVLGRAMMLEEEIDDPAVRNSLGRLRAAAERCARIVKSFLALARQKAREPKPVDVRAVLDAGLEMLASNLRSAGVEVVREDAPDLPPVMADEDELHQVFLNLIVNACQALEAMPPVIADPLNPGRFWGEPRRLWVLTSTVEGGEPQIVRVGIADNGPGVPAELRGQIFDPFFTTKPVGAGTGLGLSVCHGIVSTHGGTITVEERSGGGACFVVTLPACPVEQGAAAGLAAAGQQGRGGDVLVVDDEPEVVTMLKEALTREGHHVVTAPNGAAALEVLRTGRFDVVLCDIRMPHLDGPGLLRALEMIRPDLAGRVLLMTGDVLRAAAALPPTVASLLLEKPLDPAEVRRRVRDLIE